MDRKLTASLEDVQTIFGSLGPADFSAPLLEWYNLHERPLPWREKPTAYRVWVSEIMLQQTRIEAVLPYFERFMEALPTVQDLAFAETDFLMKLWEGLGYYSRARNLQKAAQQIVERWNGNLPASYEQLLSLPGIGEYTAGAVASIAFDIPVPAVDGNVMRVLARLFARQEDVMIPASKKFFWQIAREMVPDEKPGRFNQAIMELGETICLPNTAPKCAECPLSGQCQAYKQGCQRQLPIRSSKKSRRLQERTIFVLLSQGKDGIRRVLLHRRPETGLLSGLWELPGADVSLDVNEAMEAVEGYGHVLNSRILPEGKHIFTHIEWHMKGYAFTLSSFSDVQEDEYHWVTVEELASNYALPSAFRIYSRLLPVLLEQKEN